MKPVLREPQYYWFAALLSLLLVLVSSLQAEQDLYHSWLTEEYSHGFLIPCVAFLLAWNLLAHTKPVLRPSWLGLSWLILGAILHVISVLSAFEMAAQFGLLCAIVGLCLAFLGRLAAWIIAPALFYLIFAIPLPHLMQANLSEQLQLLSSTLGVWPLDYFGVPVFQEGNVIDLGGYKLQVIEACNGLRYLFPLMSFGYLIAYLLDDKIWKRLVILISAIPITIALNSLRIAFIGFTVNKWGPQMAEGFLHDFEGWSVFLLCTVILLFETWILKRIGNRGRFRYELLGLPESSLLTSSYASRTPGLGMLLATFICAIVFVSGTLDQRNEIIPLHPPLSSFPLSLGGWHGHNLSIDTDILDNLKLSDYWIADYNQDKIPAPVNFYIAYYAQQRIGASTHSPSNCIPGGGWQIEKSETKTVVTSANIPVTLTRLLIRRETTAELVYYWFDERGRDLTETTSAKWFLLWDSLFMHRTDGALIRLITPIMGHETETSAEQRLDAFLSLVQPEIKHYIPGPTN